MLAALFQALSTRFDARRPAMIAAGSLVVFFLANYGCFIERGYVDAWQIQKRFWKQVAALTPDLDGKTSLVVVGGHPKQNPVIESNSWADFLLLTQLTKYCYRAPTASLEPPHFMLLDNASVYCQSNSGISELWKIKDGQLFAIVNPTLPKYVKLDEENIILLRINGETLTRIDSWLLPSVNRELHSKPLGSNSGYWDKLTRLGRLMLGSRRLSSAASK